MIRLIPTWKQFRRLSLPSKLTVLGFYVTLIGIVLSIAFYVVSRTKVPSPPPITVEEIDTVRAQGFSYAAKIRKMPMASSVYAAQLKPLAEKLWADDRYADQAPKESVLIFRLYAATLLLTRPAGGDFIGQVRGAMPWLKKAIAVDERSEPRSKDYEDVKAAQQFFASVAEGKMPNVKASVMLTHQFRVAMPEADETDVQKKVEEAVKLILEMVSPRPDVGSVSAKEDFEYLQAYRVPSGFTVSQLMRTFQLMLKSKFPEKNVGGDPLFVPLPNGNTKVTYIFKGNSTLFVEWEVNKAKRLVRPLTEAAQSMMSVSAEK
jgi:hypothetical protein